jgi:hypothetical protein
MNTLLRSSLISLTIVATFGAISLRAQETTSPDPITASNTTPTTPTRPTAPSTPVTPDTSTPANPVVPPSTAPSQAGSCNPVTLSSNSADTESTYTAGPMANTTSASSPEASSNMPMMPSTANNMSTSDSSSVTSRGQTYTSEGINVNAPRLLSASSNQAQERHEIGPSHHIELYTGNNVLCYLSIQPVEENVKEFNEKIRVFNDATNDELGITVTKEQDGGARVVFAQPVPPGTTLEVELNGVEYNSQTSPNVVQYYLAGGYAEFNQEIPYGIAQVNRFLY